MQTSPIAGGQSAADRALASFDVAGYAANRNEVWPPSRRGASGLSPYIRHGLLSLRRVWDHVAGGPPRDVGKFRDELLWQEYGRHLYARVGSRTGTSLRYRVAERRDGQQAWPEEAACLAESAAELRRSGWLPNQSRMWWASQWTVRAGRGWRDGEDFFFRHLLDGSRAANRLGWQWTVGALTGRPYLFTREQVRRRAPTMCAECPLSQACPVETPPDERALAPVADAMDLLRHDSDVRATAGPERADVSGAPRAVWVTAESLGLADPALAAHPDLPVVFVVDEGLLRRVRLAAVRLVFLAQTLAELAEHRDLRVYRGLPREVLPRRALAATFTPVPGWRRLAATVTPVTVHPWPWLQRPGGGRLQSFSAWRRSAAK